MSALNGALGAASGHKNVDPAIVNIGGICRAVFASGIRRGFSTRRNDVAQVGYHDEGTICRVR